MELSRMTFGEDDFVSLGAVQGAPQPTGYMFAYAHGSVTTVEMTIEEMRGLAQMLKDCAARVEDVHETEGWE